MLESLHVKNIALIDETTVEFGKGLNILTGETGAGKSIIIGSINIALGAKADKNMIRSGADMALVQLLFRVTSEQAKRLQSFDVYPEEDGTLLLERRITPVKSVCKINGEMIASKTLKNLAEILIDIHGQHEHQSLLQKKHQVAILDEFCGEELSAVSESLRSTYYRFEKEKQELAEAQETSENKEKQLDFARYELDEIIGADLQIGEDEGLEKAYQKMTHARKIGENVSAAHEAINGEGSKNASTLLGYALRELNLAKSYDEALEDCCEQLSTMEDMLFQLGRDLDSYIQELNFNEHEFSEIEERLNVINHLKNKYGKTMEEILSYAEEKQKEIDKLEDFEHYINERQKEHEKTKKELLILCRKASDIRKKQAIILEKEMTDTLQELNFPEVKFKIAILTDEEKIGSQGYNETEFMISLNPGEGLKPLREVASGGELSRIMLALKTVLADKDQIETLIFDEIDAGISGTTAWKVAEKMAILGKNHQILCITHLPQIASMADEHFIIQKETKETYANTTIFELSRNEMITEIARLLGSDMITDAVIKNAKELKDMADKTKEY